MEPNDAPPAAEKPEPVAETPKVEAKPENPVDALREQALALVSDENRSQLAALIKSMLEHKPSERPERKSEPQESEKVAERYNGMPFRPRITREARTPTSGGKYGSLSGD